MEEQVRRRIFEMIERDAVDFMDNLYMALRTAKIDRASLFLDYLQYDVPAGDLYDRIAQSIIRYGRIIHDG